MAKHTGVRKLPNGRFRARYFKGYDEDGKRVYPARTFDTEREAREWRSTETADRRRGAVAGAGVTVTSYLAHWLNTKQGLRENSRENYSQHIDHYVLPKLGRIKLSRLEATHIEEWQADLLTRLSPATVSVTRAILYGALKSALRKGIIRCNVVELTDGPTQRKSRRHPLTIDEALRIIEAVKGSRYGLLLELMAVCGLRPEEAVALTWNNLELAGPRGLLHVRRVIHFLKGGKWRWHDPKSAHGIRSIAFPGELAGRLLDHRRTQLEAKIKAGPYWKSHDLVFSTRTGTPIRFSYPRSLFKRYLGQAGLPTTIQPYDLRHFFVTSSLIAGVDIKTASREAGHSKVSFTLEKYGHVLDEMHETASDKRESLLKTRASQK